MTLMSEIDNVRFSKHVEIKGKGYQKYVNYDAIEVPFVDAIPSDCTGVMGVPISILDKYNPDQFEIIGNMDDHDDMRRIGGQPIDQKFMDGYRAAGGTGAQRAGGYWVGLTNPHRFPYKRIFIKRRKAV